MIESLDLPTLPGGWVWTRLGEIVVEIERGNPKDTPERDFIYLDIASIDNNQQKITNPKKYFGENAPSRARQIVKSGDILFSTVRTYLKNIAIVNDIYDGQIASTGFCVIRPYDLINQRLIFYLVQTDFFLNPLTQIQRGTSYPAVRDSDVFAQFIPLPPLSEQHRIVAKIEELFTKQDAGVKSLEKTKAQLKRYRQSVLKHAFEGKLTEEWRERHKDELEPASLLLERIKEERKKTLKGKYKELPPLDTSELSELPEGWVWTRLNDVISENLIGIVRSSSQQNKNDHGYGYIKMNNVTMDGKVVLSDLVYVDAYEGELERYSLRKGDILFNTRNSVELVGKTGIVRFDAEKFVYNNNLMRIRTSDQISPYFLVYQICSHQFRSRMEKVKRATTNVAALYAKDILPLPVLLMPQAEQHKIAEEIERRFSVADKVERTVKQTLKQSERLHQSILKKAFEGKLVPQDPTDEPASVLLERIKEEREKREIEGKSKNKNKRKRDLVQKQRRFNDYVE